MTTDDDAATYAEINDVSREAFEMVDNKCYSNVRLVELREVGM